MTQIEDNNFRQIELLNQRGGRTLSIVDLIEANTLSVEMAAFLLYAVSHGASFMTAARPGNAGKTTLLACLLGFLRPGTEIVTVAEPGILSNTPKGPRVCFLVHEIGDGPYYGYLWGRSVNAFFDVMGEGAGIASCIHADTLEELEHILTGPPLGVSKRRFDQLDLLMFLRLEGTFWAYKRRVAALYESAPAGHHLIFNWDEKSDAFSRTGASALLGKIAKRCGKAESDFEDELSDFEAFTRRLVDEGEKDFVRVRRKVVEFLGRGGLVL